MQTAASEALLERLTSRTARVAVVGLGYVGLPLLVEFGKCGYRAVGVDIDHRKVAKIMSGRSYIADVPASEVAQLRAAQRLTATTDFAALETVDTINICVPTPLRKTKDPDLSYVVSAVEAVAKHLKPGVLVVLESTTYPGTTEEVVKPLLEKGGLLAGCDFHLAFSPERVDPGNPRFKTRNVPKVVGGLTPRCAHLAAALYAPAIDEVVKVSSTRVAELVKLLENTFRAVNIGLVNELALMCDSLGLSVWEVIEAAQTKPFGFMPFYPGPGLGGHCIPIDPIYLSWKARQHGFEPRFIELAAQINSAMPQHVVNKISAALNVQRKAINGSRILIAGVTYKSNIDDLRESPALDVMALLHRRGATLSYSDPYVRTLAATAWAGGQTLASQPLDAATLAAVDCCAILTDHRGVDYTAVAAGAAAVVDTRNAIKGNFPHVFRLGAPSTSASARPAAALTV